MTNLDPAAANHLLAARTMLLVTAAPERLPRNKGHALITRALVAAGKLAPLKSSSKFPLCSMILNFSPSVGCEPDGQAGLVFHSRNSRSRTLYFSAVPPSGPAK